MTWPTDWGFPGQDLNDETYLVIGWVFSYAHPLREIHMGIVEIVLTAIGLSMDAFAVSICKGLSTDSVKLRHSIITGLYFGFFQALMPVLGYYLGINFQEAISSIDHWIAFVLLLVIGINMIRESRSEDDDHSSGSYDVKTMLVLAVATSIDALAVGISFALLDVEIFSASLIIGVITFILSAVGVKAGCKLGEKSRKAAEMAGGIILILIGLKILLEHLGIF